MAIKSMDKIKDLVDKTLNTSHSYDELKACLKLIRGIAEEHGKNLEALSDNLALIDTKPLADALMSRASCGVIFFDPSTDEPIKIWSRGGYASLGLIEVCKPTLKGMLARNLTELPDPT